MTTDVPGGRSRRRRAMRRGVARAVGAAAVFSIPVIALALVVGMPESPLVALDQRLVQAATDITRTSPELRQALILWQEAFQGRWVNLVGTGLCVWVWRRHGLRARALLGFLTLMVSCAMCFMPRSRFQ